MCIYQAFNWACFHGPHLVRVQECPKGSTIPVGVDNQLPYLCYTHDIVGQTFYMTITCWHCHWHYSRISGHAVDAQAYNLVHTAIRQRETEKLSPEHQSYLRRLMSEAIACVNDWTIARTMNPDPVPFAGPVDIPPTHLVDAASTGGRPVMPSGIPPASHVCHPSASTDSPLPLRQVGNNDEDTADPDAAWDGSGGHTGISIGRVYPSMAQKMEDILTGRSATDTIGLSAIHLSRQFAHGTALAPPIRTLESAQVGASGKENLALHPYNVTSAGALESGSDPSGHIQDLSAGQYGNFSAGAQESENNPTFTHSLSIETTTTQYAHCSVLVPQMVAPESSRSGSGKGKQIASQYDISLAGSWVPGNNPPLHESNDAAYLAPNPPNAIVPYGGDAMIDGRFNENPGAMDLEAFLEETFGPSEQDALYLGPVSAPIIGSEAMFDENDDYSWMDAPPPRMSNTSSSNFDLAYPPDRTSALQPIRAEQPIPDFSSMLSDDDLSWIDPSGELETIPGISIPESAPTPDPLEGTGFSFNDVIQCPEEPQTDSFGGDSRTDEVPHMTSTTTVGNIGPTIEQGGQHHGADPSGIDQSGGGLPVNELPSAQTLHSVGAEKTQRVFTAVRNTRSESPMDALIRQHSSHPGGNDSNDNSRHTVGTDIRFSDMPREQKESAGGTPGTVSTSADKSPATEHSLGTGPTMTGGPGESSASGGSLATRRNTTFPGMTFGNLQEAPSHNQTNIQMDTSTTGTILQQGGSHTPNETSGMAPLKRVASGQEPVPDATSGSPHMPKKRMVREE